MPMMSNRPFSSIDRSNFVSNPRSEGEMYMHTSSLSDNGVEQNCPTLREA